MEEQNVRRVWIDTVCRGSAERNANALLWFPKEQRHSHYHSQQHWMCHRNHLPHLVLDLCPQEAKGNGHTFVSIVNFHVILSISLFCMVILAMLVARMNLI